jgi:hypothetical protein
MCLAWVGLSGFAPRDLLGQPEKSEAFPILVMADGPSQTECKLELSSY